MPFVVLIKLLIIKYNNVVINSQKFIKHNKL